MMNVQDLMDMLSGMDPNAEVRLATQPEWPLAFELAGVAEPDDDEMPEGVVWLVTGNHPQDTPYAPEAAWSVAQRY